MARVSKERAAKHLVELADRAHTLVANDPYHKNSDFIAWRNDAVVVIESIFGRDSTQFRSFNRLNFCVVNVLRQVPASMSREQCARDLQEAEALLRSMATLGLEFLQGADGTERHSGDASKDVFVVHGHDEALREKVARCIQKLGLNPIILHEQTNRGRTLIEKLLHHGAQSGFAVILITADDEGRKITRDGDPAPLTKRARQNVVFEFGLFVALLGRTRVAALLQQGVEKPSDIDGIAYISVSGNWEGNLVKELRDAGYEVDANKL